MSEKHDLSPIPLPGMDVYFGATFFHDTSDRPSRLHKHPCHELVCIDSDEGMLFTVNPPLYNHVSADAALSVTSFLFSFTDAECSDICATMKLLHKPVTVKDTFGGREHVQSIRTLRTESSPGVTEQLTAEFRLLFVKLSRVLYPSFVEADTRPAPSLDDKRMAILEEYFNIRLKDPNCSKTQLADTLGVSERQLSRILLDTYGETFRAILLESRMTVAQAMLCHGRSAADTAQAVGYTSLSSFKGAYKNYFGRPFGNG